MKPDEVLYDGGDDPQPMDRLTRLADVGRKAMNASPEWQEDDKLIISLTGKREDGKVGGGMFVAGYGNDPDDEEFKDYPPGKREQAAKNATAAEVVAVLIEHAQAVLAEALGVPVKIVPVQTARLDQVMPFIARFPN